MTQMRVSDTNGGSIYTHGIHGAGIYTNIGGIFMVNVTIYSIHGSYGISFGQMLTRRATKRLKRFPASQFNGLSAFGSRLVQRHGNPFSVRNIDEAQTFF